MLRTREIGRIVVVALGALAAGCGSHRPAPYPPRYAQVPPPPPPGALARYPSGVRITPGPGVVPPPAPYAPPPPPVGPVAPLLSGPPMDASAGALVEVDRRLSQSGFRRMGAAITGVLPPGGFAAYSFDVQPGLCYTLIGVGGPSVADLNVVLYSPFGMAVAQDVRPDNHPIVQYCAMRPGRHTARVFVMSGSGNYYVVAYSSLPGTQATNLAALWAPQGPSAPPAPPPGGPPDQMPPDIAGRLDAVDARQAAAGLRRWTAPVGFAMQRGETRRIPVDIAGGRCYSFATFGGAGARDTDVFVHGPTGQRLVADGGAALDAVTRPYCPRESGPHQIEVRMYAGAGALYLAAYAGAGDGPGLVLPTMGLESTAVSRGPEEAFNVADADLRSRGYAPMGTRVAGSVQAGQAAVTPLTFDRGSCYAVLGVAEPTLNGLVLTVQDPAGEAVDMDRLGGARPTVRVCPDQDGPYRAVLQAEGGQGAYLLRAYRWPRGISGPFGLRGLLYVRMSEMTTMLAPEQFELSGAPDVANVSAGGSRSRNVDLAAGRCYVLLGVGGRAVTDVAMTLRRGNTVVAEAPAGASAQIRHCPEAGRAGRHQLTVRLAASSGQVLTQVYEHSD